jgi:hypothetical protein
MAIKERLGKSGRENLNKDTEKYERDEEGGEIKKTKELRTHCRCQVMSS